MKRKKSRSIINVNNLLIILCFILIGVSVYILLKPDEKDNATKTIGDVANKQEKTQNQTTKSNQTVKENNVKVVKNQDNSKEISEQEARNLAKKQFKELNENGVNEKDFEVIEFTRANEYYYYISSKENTIEIKKDGGKITRINSVPVESSNP